MTHFWWKSIWHREKCSFLPVLTVIQTLENTPFPFPLTWTSLRSSPKLCSPDAWLSAPLDCRGKCHGSLEWYLLPSPICSPGSTHPNCKDWGLWTPPSGTKGPASSLHTKSLLAVAIILYVLPKRAPVAVILNVNPTLEGFFSPS